MSMSIFDEDNAFSPSVMQYILKRLDVKIKTISQYNHGSLKQKGIEEPQVK